MRRFVAYVDMVAQVPGPPVMTRIQIKQESTPACLRGNFFESAEAALAQVVKAYGCIPEGLEVEYS